MLVENKKKETGIQKYSGSGFGVKIGTTTAEDELVISSKVQYMHSLMMQRFYLPVNCIQ